MSPTSRALVGHPRYAISCVVRVVIIWFAIRAAALLAGGVIAGLQAALFFAAFVSAIVLIDARATRELVYMRNLGLPARWLVTMAVVLALVLEMLFNLIA